jgi:hypothetical protein
VNKWVRAATGIGLGALAASGPAQTPTGDPIPTASRGLSGEVVRQIADPGRDGTWLLIRNPVHPAGPGRLIWVPRGGQLAGQAQLADQARIADQASSPAVPVTEAALEALKPVILAGDRLVVEEETPVVDARLEATALGPAPAGAALNVRLEIGGKVMRAIALGPGRARFAYETQPASGTGLVTGNGAQP